MKVAMYRSYDEIVICIQDDDGKIITEDGTLFGDKSGREKHDYDCTEVDLTSQVIIISYGSMRVSIK